jgi:hypothetical protein
MRGLAANILCLVVNQNEAEKPHRGDVRPRRTSIFFSPLPQGEGGEPSEPGEGLLSSGPARDLLPHLAYEPLRVLQHQSIRIPQQAYADSCEVIFLGGVSPHLTGLRVNAAVELDGAPMLKAIEIDDPVLSGEISRPGTGPAAGAMPPFQCPFAYAAGLVGAGLGCSCAECSSTKNKHELFSGGTDPEADASPDSLGSPPSPQGRGLKSLGPSWR